MVLLLRSEDVHPMIDELLLSGQAHGAHEAEEMFLNTHLDELVQLAIALDDQAFEQHEAVKLLMSHGSRQLEDALRW